MNIVYVANEAYVRHLAVSMYSLMDRNQVAEQLKVFVLSAGITEESQDKLRQAASGFGRELVILPMGDLRARFPYPVDTGSFDISAMGRLFVGSMLPKEVGKVLYLDCDTVVLASLKKLWEIELDGYLLGAVMEPTIYPEVKRGAGLAEDDPYFNSGVLLIDVDKWRKEEAEGQLVRFYKSLGGKTFACDQDTLNGALKGRIKPLSPRYNFFTNYRYFHYRDLTGQSPSYRKIPREVFERAKKHPAILHFAGDERPWKAGNLSHYRMAYDQYLAMTPWRGTLKETKKGQRGYLFAYHMMDYLTWVCPPARKWISRKFGMKMVEAKALNRYSINEKEQGDKRDGQGKESQLCGGKL